MYNIQAVLRSMYHEHVVSIVEYKIMSVYGYIRSDSYHARLNPLARYIAKH